jgi:lipopolysaccharide/colanic/teichoic acid biosynthesis glycosyltransferase
LKPIRKQLGRGLKRMVDLLMSAVIGVALLPLVGLIALLIKLDSEGPVIHRAKRVGMGGRTFVLYKFRSMFKDAEARLRELAHLNRGGPHLIKIPNDPRVTRIGRVLRKYSFDEIPQVWNVIKGDMSLVGPRPQAPNEVALYSPEQGRRLSVPPGITGLWQVTARSDPRFETMVSKDLEYIDQWSFWLDIRIILKTVSVVLMGKDASPKS